MANPRQRHLAGGELGKSGPDVLAGPGRQKRLPDQLVKKGARIEVLARGQIFEGTRQGLAAAAAVFCLGKTELNFVHHVLLQPKTTAKR
jgi:hypothetical protein